jgi:hypothetical protein
LDRPLYALDCETDPFRRGRLPHPFAWGLACESSFRKWWGVGREADVAAHLGRLPEDAIVYAHNGGRFDFHFLLPFADPGEILLIRGRIARMKIGGRELRDSWLLIPEPLAASGLKSTIDYATMEADRREAHRESILAYLRADCEALLALVTEFHAQHRGHPLTLPSAALARWLEVETIKRPHTSEALDGALRRYYFGGRVEALALGELRGPWQVYDVNSAYAAAMAAQEHAAGWPLTSTRLPEDSALAYTLALIVADSDGALPVRDPEGKIEYPRIEGARFRTTGHEIIAGLETRRLRIRRVILSHYFPGRLPFDRFVAHYWEARRHAQRGGDQLRALIAKRTMNAVYGKLGQDPRRRFQHWIQSADREPPFGFQPAGRLGPWMLYAQPNPSPHAYLSVATAASITGAVRAQLLRVLAAAEEPVYCDTDSVICRSLPERLIGSRLGAWKNEATLDRLAVGGRKLYAGYTTDRRWKWACKGARLAPEEVYRIAAEGEPLRWESEAPTYSITRAPSFVSRVIRRAT